MPGKPPLTPENKAAALIAESGPPGAWHAATREAIEAHLSGRAIDRAYWKAVQVELLRTAPRPGPGDLDIYRTAKMLIARHGSHQAWHVVMERATREQDTLHHQAIYLRVADAIKALSPGGPEEGRTEF